MEPELSCSAKGHKARWKSRRINPPLTLYRVKQNRNRESGETQSARDQNNRRDDLRLVAHRRMPHEAASTSSLTSDEAPAPCGGTRSSGALATIRAAILGASRQDACGNTRARLDDDAHVLSRARDTQRASPRRCAPSHAASTRRPAGYGDVEINSASREALQSRGDVAVATPRVTNGFRRACRAGVQRCDRRGCICVLREPHAVAQTSTSSRAPGPVACRVRPRNRGPRWQLGRDARSSSMRPRGGRGHRSQRAVRCEMTASRGDAVARREPDCIESTWSRSPLRIDDVHASRTAAEPTSRRLRRFRHLRTAIAPEFRIRNSQRHVAAAFRCAKRGPAWLVGIGAIDAYAACKATEREVYAPTRRPSARSIAARNHRGDLTWCRDREPRGAGWANPSGARRRARVETEIDGERMERVIVEPSGASWACGRAAGANPMRSERQVR